MVLLSLIEMDDVEKEEKSTFKQLIIKKKGCATLEKIDSVCTTDDSDRG